MILFSPIGTISIIEGMFSGKWGVGTALDLLLNNINLGNIPINYDNLHNKHSSRII